MSKTSLPLRNLRGVLLLLIVAFHCFSAYIVTQPTTPPAFDLPPFDWRVFPIIDNERWLGFDLFCAFQFLYLMQFMFFLSGLFVWPSLQRKGWKGFLAHRLVRLGIPFVIGVYLLMPIAFYPVYRVTAVEPSWSSFWAHWTALPITPTGPMWFLWYLIALDFCAAAIYKLTAGRRGPVAHAIEKVTQRPRTLFIVLVAITALSYLPLSALYSPWYWHRSGRSKCRRRLLRNTRSTFWSDLRSVRTALTAAFLIGQARRCDGGRSGRSEPSLHSFSGSFQRH